MSRPLLRTAVVAAALAIISGGYLVIDAIHRFVVGDFLRIGGQLGPWAVLVGAVGIDPLSMGPVFLVIGSRRARRPRCCSCAARGGRAPCLRAPSGLWGASSSTP